MTKRTYTHKVAAVAGAVALLAQAGRVAAQSADALIDKLVDKGILSVKEANELREESDRNFSSAIAVKTGMPDWVTGYKISGDFRGRFEKFTGDNENFVDRNRMRYRLRVGLTVNLKDDLEAGFRLSSGDTVGGFTTQTGNPISANTTFQDNFSRKFIYVDAAYGKWTPVHNANWTVAATIGKMDNPFRISNMVFDYDLDPEGVALQMAYQINSSHSLSLNTAAFILDEESASTHDPLMYGAQLIWDAKWTPRIESSVGVSFFNIENPESLTTANVPFYNQGNSRTAAGVLVNDYDPIIVSPSLTYKFEKFPFYKGEFPVKLAGEYLYNPGASKANEGYWVGFTLGKAGTKKNWSLSYRYQELQADAWYDAMADDDNGAFYANSPSGGKTGFFGGTNIKGHLLILNYSLTDALSFVFTGYVNDLVDAHPGGISEPHSHSIHGMADLMWKF